MTVQPTVRLRLTLAFGGLFLVAGGVLLALNYVFVRASLDRDRVTARIAMPVPAPETGVVTEAPFPMASEPLIIEGRRASVAEFERRVKDSTLDALVLQSAQTLALMAIASVGVGWVVAGRVLKPVHDITAAARRLSQENLHERIALAGPRDELKELADTFDAMLARLETAFDSQRRFVANASHELRTPLSIIRTEIDVALADPDVTPEELRAMARNVRDATERSERLVDSLLVLARSDRGPGAPTARERVALDELAAEVVGQLGAEAEARGLDVRAEVEPGVAVVGDRQLLERVVANLVENAIRHNVRERRGTVDVAVFARGADVVVRVANTGASVPADEVEALFEPFRRLAPDRTAGSDRRGVGLGLSIVRSVARAHGGTATARARPEGGLEVEVELPAAATGSGDDRRGGDGDHR